MGVVQKLKGIIKKRKDEGMKKIVALIMCMCLILSLAACGSSNEVTNSQQPTKSTESKNDSPEPSASAGEKGFVGITTSMYTNEAIGRMCDIIAENLKAEGYTVQICDANFDQALQTSQVEDFISQKAALVIIEACDSVGVKSAYEKCKDAGIPTLSVSQILDKSVIDLPSGVLTLDNYKGGWIVGEEVAKQLNYKGNVCAITYDVAYVCRERSNGFLDALKQYKDINILEVFDGICTEDDAMQKTEDWLQQYDQIDALYGSNTNAATGIAAALRSANLLDETIVCDVDGQPADLRNMESGAVDVIAVGPILELAEFSSKAALEIIETGKCFDDPCLEFELCTKDDIAKWKKYWGME